MQVYQHEGRKAQPWSTQHQMTMPSGVNTRIQHDMIQSLVTFYELQHTWLVYDYVEPKEYFLSFSL